MYMLYKNHEIPNLFYGHALGQIAGDPTNCFNNNGWGPQISLATNLGKVNYQRDVRKALERRHKGLWVQNSLQEEE